ncbi:hypothetical protein CPB85DRAFT_240707 [Mucidula mucida]|nr:hypothetical protein CPB85DRAFT_240707 [Mucidula mucida]
MPGHAAAARLRSIFILFNSTLMATLLKPSFGNRWPASCGETQHALLKLSYSRLLDSYQYMAFLQLHNLNIAVPWHHLSYRTPLRKSKTSAHLGLLKVLSKFACGLMRPHQAELRDLLLELKSGGNVTLTIMRCSLCY